MVSGKTGERELIARHNVRRYLDRIKSRLERIKPNDYVFRLISMKRTYSMNATFEQLLIESNLLKDRRDENRTLYSLRHTYATFQILNGVDYHALSVNMGTSISMLEKHHSHLLLPQKNLLEKVFLIDLNKHHKFPIPPAL